MFSVNMYSSAVLFLWPVVSTFAYVTYQDIKQAGNLRDQTVIVIKAPTDTKLEVPDPDEVCMSMFLSWWNFQIIPRSVYNLTSRVDFYQSVHPDDKEQSRSVLWFWLINSFCLQSLSIHLTSTKGPIEVLLCSDEENDPRSPVKNGNMDINGNSTFLKVLQGLFQLGVSVDAQCVVQRLLYF